MNTVTEDTIKNLSVAEAIQLIDQLRAHINQSTFGVYAIGAGADSTKAAVVNFDLESTSMRIIIIDRTTGLRVRLLDELTPKELADYSTLILLYDSWDGQDTLIVPLLALDDVSLGFDLLPVSDLGEDCPGEEEV